MKIVFLIAFCLWAVQAQTGDSGMKKEGANNLIVFGNARKSFLTNVTELIFSANCQIALQQPQQLQQQQLQQPQQHESSSQLMGEQQQQQGGTLQSYLETESNKCSENMNKILEKYTITQCEEMSGSEDGKMVRSKFFFSPIYRMMRPKYDARPYPHPRPRPRPRFPRIDQFPHLIDRFPFRRPKKQLTLIGHLGRQMMVVCVPTSEAGLLMAELAKSNTTIQSLRSILPQTSVRDLRQQVLKQAVQNALKDADTLLGDMGVKRSMYSIDIATVNDPQFGSIIVDKMSHLPHLLVSKRSLNAGVRLIVNFEGQPAMRKQQGVGETDQFKQKNATTAPVTPPVKEPSKEPLKEPSNLNATAPVATAPLKEPLKEPSNLNATAPVTPPVNATAPLKEPEKEPLKEPEKGQETKKNETNINF